MLLLKEQWPGNAAVQECICPKGKLISLIF